jgi:hypothetical protein
MTTMRKFKVQMILLWVLLQAHLWGRQYERLQRLREKTRRLDTSTEPEVFSVSGNLATVTEGVGAVAEEIVAEKRLNRISRRIKEALGVMPLQQEVKLGERMLSRLRRIDSVLAHISGET